MSRLFFARSALDLGLSGKQLRKLEDHGLSEKQLRKLDQLSDDAMLPGKGFKPEKRDAEVKLIKKMEQVLQREQ
jgi:hypothetical protein